LLVAAVLLARSLYDLRTFNTGFRRDHLLLVMPDTGRAIPDATKRLRYTNMILDDIRRLPGVRSASRSVVIPMEGSSWQRDFTAPGYAGRTYGCYMNLVSPGFFQTIGTRLLTGRDFSNHDDAAGQKVAVVNESFARRYWSGENPVGKSFREVDKNEPITVIGVVEDAKYRDFRKEARPTVYLPLAQAPSTLGWSINFEIWTYTEPHAVIKSVQNILDRQLKDVPVVFQTFNELVDRRLLYERLLTALSICFGGLAIIMCVVGIYGVASYSVNRRTAEIGVRMALGATRSSVVGLVLREQLLLLAAGTASGLAAASIASHLIQSWLFGVSPGDAMSLAAAAIVLTSATLLAAFFPARRAAGVDPIAALRYE
jgi:predicted permease